MREKKSCNIKYKIDSGQQTVCKTSDGQGIFSPFPEIFHAQKQQACFYELFILNYLEFCIEHKTSWHLNILAINQVEQRQVSHDHARRQLISVAFTNKGARQHFSPLSEIFFIQKQHACMLLRIIFWSFRTAEVLLDMSIY